MPLKTAIAEMITSWRTEVPLGDRQMAMNRFLAGVLVLVFNVIAIPRGALVGMPLLLPTVYILVGWIAAVNMVVWPRASTGRRVFLLGIDCAALSFEMYLGGGPAAWLFAAYLWTISGYGYRFGVRFQIYAMSFSTSGFCMMAAATTFWREQPALVVGGFICLTAVPLYAIALIRNLSRAQKQAEEANKAKSLFLTSVSHDLRTPLNAVLGMGALLERSELDGEQRQMSQTIMAAARSLLSLINGILDMSLIEVGQLAVARTDFDLALLLNEIRTIFAAQERMKSLKLNVHITARTPLLLHGDARQLHETLLNLVGNAMKFTDSGSITVTADTVAQHDGQLRLRFEVTDTGIGIAPAAHERIFEIFTQADETIVNRFGGTGLGLALVRKSVQLLGGEIDVLSVPGAGSTFWFELPMQSRLRNPQPGQFSQLRALVHAEHPSAVAPLLGRLADLGIKIDRVAAALPGWPASTSADSLCVMAFAGAGAQSDVFVDVRQAALTGMPDAAARLSFASVLHLAVSDDELLNVLSLVAAASDREGANVKLPKLPIAREPCRLLVADDNETNRYVINKILSSAGHHVTLVNNGEEALDALDEMIFDIAVLDVNMPIMDGIEAAKIYRMTAPGDSAIPVIALTADATPATRERCLDAGMASCLVKPVEPAHLLAVIDEILQKGNGVRKPREAAAVDPRITEIAAHPRFRGNVLPAVDSDVLDSLRDLGGESFVTEVCELFRGETRATMQGLRTDVLEGNVLNFRAHAHALRSVAANIGARQLYEICGSVQSVSAKEMHQNSQIWLEQVAAELVRIDTRLENFYAEPTALAKH